MSNIMIHQVSLQTVQHFQLAQHHRAEYKTEMETATSETRQRQTQSTNLILTTFPSKSRTAKADLNFRIMLFKILPCTCDCTTSPYTRNKGINLPTSAFPDLWSSSLVVDLKVGKIRLKISTTQIQEMF